MKSSNLFLFFFLLIIRKDEVEESELVNASGRRDNTNPVSKRVLLKELLGQVLGVLSRELGQRNNSDLVSLTSDSDQFIEVTSTALDLDVLNKEFLEGSDINDLVLSVCNGVDDKLFSPVRNHEARKIVNRNKIKENLPS